MNRLEHRLADKGHTNITGVDEAGRGPLAGPVVAAAVILPVGYLNEAIKDSKTLTPARRESLFFTITEDALDYSIGISTSEEIDRYNILRASLLAMERAVRTLAHSPGVVLVDGRFPIPNLKAEQVAVRSGDMHVMSIAAASIVAKVSRDMIMERYHDFYPWYNFAAHKGYPTREHKKAIDTYGPCPIHRKTFKGIRLEG